MGIIVEVSAPRSREVSALRGREVGWNIINRMYLTSCAKASLYIVDEVYIIFESLMLLGVYNVPECIIR